MSCPYRETREALEPCFIFCVKMNLESAQPSPTFGAQKSHKLPRDDEIVEISLHYNCA